MKKGTTYLLGFGVLVTIIIIVLMKKGKAAATDTENTADGALGTFFLGNIGSGYSKNPTESFSSFYQRRSANDWSFGGLFG